MQESPRPKSDSPAGAQGAPAVRVVLVDDDEVSRRILEKMLVRDGCEVDVHGDAESALAALRSSSPDVLVADWMMPKMSGPDLVKAVRADPTTQATYCILVTGHREETNRIAGLMLGADDYLTKPVSESELVARVRVGVRVRRLQRNASHLDLAARLGAQISDPLGDITTLMTELRARLAEGDATGAAAAMDRAENGVARIQEAVRQLIELGGPRADAADDTSEGSPEE